MCKLIRLRGRAVKGPSTAGLTALDFSEARLRTITVECAHSGWRVLLRHVSYIPRAALTLIDLDLLLALLNSKLTDWYFTIGSTNSKVNEYQFNNLPCPMFRSSRSADDQALLDDLLSLLNRNLADILPALEPYLEEAPFNPAVEQLLIALSRRVRQTEEARGPIGRAERAHLPQQRNLIRTPSTPYSSG
jgi:hypothetical protein